MIICARLNPLKEIERIFLIYLIKISWKKTSNSLHFLFSKQNSFIKGPSFIFILSQLFAYIFKFSHLHTQLIVIS